jgi:hypothetical protein
MAIQLSVRVRIQASAPIICPLTANLTWISAEPRRWPLNIQSHVLILSQAHDVLTTCLVMLIIEDSPEFQFKFSGLIEGDSVQLAVNTYIILFRLLRCASHRLLISYAILLQLLEMI